MAKIITVGGGQTIWDIAKQEYGDINQIGKLLSDNGLGFDALLTPGQQLTIDNEDFGNRSIQEFYETRTIRPRSLNSTTPEIFLEPEAQAFISATGITNSNEKNLVNNLVIGLKIDGIWDKLIVLYPFVGGTALAHSYNLIDTTQFQITWYNTITHDADGVQGDSITGYGDMGAGSATIWNDIDNSGMTAIMKSTDTGAARYIYGLSGPGLDETTFRLTGVGVTSVGARFHKASTALTQNIDLTNRGFISVHRTAANTKLYSGTTEIDSAANEGNLSAVSMFVLATTIDGINPVAPSSDQIYGIILHEALDGTERTALQNRMETFNTGLSR